MPRVQLLASSLPVATSRGFHRVLARERTVLGRSACLLESLVSATGLTHA
jgi:hypothetical protein